MKGKVTSLAIVGVMLLGSLLTIISASSSVSASTTGDVYGGSGNWVINDPTTYTDEIFTVYGNLTIVDGGSLTLTNSAMTVDQSGPVPRWINVSYTSGTAPWLKILSDSVIQSTDYTVGKYNTQLKVSGLGYFRMDDSILSNIWLNLVSGPGSWLKNSTLIATSVWTNYAFGYEADCPVLSGPYVFSDVVFRDTNTTGQNYLSLLTLGSQVTINNCAFDNITLPSGSPDTCAMIRALYQHNLTIVDNEFHDSIFPSIYLFGSWTDQYPIADSEISENEYLGIGTDYANLTYGNWFRGTALRTIFEDNVFHVIRNGSTGVLVTGEGWELDDNRFDMIAATALTTQGRSVGIKLEDSGNVTISGTVINDLIGPGTDLGASALGVMSIDSGNISLIHSTIRNISYSSGGIACVDSIGFNGRGNISVHANSFYNVNNLATAVYFTGATGGSITWNNVSGVGGSCAGIMIHDTTRWITVSDNSVIGLFYEPNELPLWQVSVGAYSICCTRTWNVSLSNNHAEGATATLPTYDICGINPDSSWSEHVGAAISIRENAIIRQANSNVTLYSVIGQLYMIDLDGELQSMYHYANGTSWNAFEKVDLETHWINVTVLPISAIPSTTIELTVLTCDWASDEIIATWDVDTDATVDYSIWNLENNLVYRLTKDGSGVDRGEGPSFTVIGTGSGTYQLEILYPVTVSRLVVLTVDMLALGLMVGVVGNTIRPLRDPKNRNAAQFQKVLINTVVCIVIGVVLITMVNNMFLGG